MRNVLIIMICAWAPVLWIGAAQTAASAAGLSGVVLNVTDGSAIEGAAVMYVGSGESNSGEVISDQNGEFEIAPLAPGEYVISVAADRYKERENMPYSVIAGQTTAIQVKMRKTTIFFQLFADRYGWSGFLTLLFSLAVVVLIFTLTASWLIRKAEKQS